MPEKSVREILELNFSLARQQDTDWNMTEATDKTLSALNTLFEEMMPKDKQGITFKGKHSLEPYSPRDREKVAYNEALAEVRKRWKEVMG